MLQKLHFVKKKEGTKHEEWVLESASGTAWVTTRVSRGNQDIRQGLLKSICQQLQITPRDYRLIAACSISREEYQRRLFADTSPPRE